MRHRTMTTTYQYNKRTFRLSTAGAIFGALTGMHILVNHGTVYPQFRVLLAVLVLGGLLMGLARYLEEPPWGALIGMIYATGVTTIGMVEFDHDGVFWLAVTVLLAGGILTVYFAIERWNSYLTTIIGASLGAVATGLVLYVI